MLSEEKRAEEEKKRTDDMRSKTATSRVSRAKEEEKEKAGCVLLTKRLFERKVIAEEVTMWNQVRTIFHLRGIF